MEKALEDCLLLQRSLARSISEELSAGWKAMEWGGGFRAGLMAREGGGAARWLEVHGVG